MSKKKVSYSQYKVWYTCPKKYELDYIQGKKKFEGSLHTCFGTAIHVAVQDYIKCLYTKGYQEADALSSVQTFKAEFEKELNLEGKKVTYTKEEFDSFIKDGEEILSTFLSSANRLKHFPSKKYEIVGIEMPLELDIKNNTQFIAYIDVVLKDKSTGNYKIIDIKTSSVGWNKWQQADQSKTDQLLFYKAFYSKQYNIPIDKIDVEFFILKRKLFENVAFPQSRIQTFIPIHSKKEIAKSLDLFSDFLDEGFNKDGTYNTSHKFLKNPGKARKNCKYCLHKGVDCDGKEEIEEAEK